jgi:integrase
MEAPQPPKLLDRVRQVARFRHLSRKTEKSYLYYIRDFIRFHQKRHPREMGAPEIRAYLSHLAVDKKIAASTQNVALSALLFLYRQVLRLNLPDIEGIERPQRPKRLPTVFSRAEVQAILSRVGDGSEGLFIRLLYGTGMRLTECLRLRVKDVDFDYGQIVIRDGKGKKDRVTMLPRSLIPPLQQQTLGGCRSRLARLFLGRSPERGFNSLKRQTHRGGGDRRQLVWSDAKRKVAGRLKGEGDRRCQLFVLTDTSGLASIVLRGRRGDRWADAYWQGCYWGENPSGTLRDRPHAALSQADGRGRGASSLREAV